MFWWLKSLPTTLGRLPVVIVGASFFAIASTNDDGMGLTTSPSSLLSAATSEVTRRATISNNPG